MASKAPQLNASIKKEWSIPKNGELRFEVDFNQLAVIKLLSGTAECFGMELSPNKEYEVSGVNLAIFTYEGAKVLLKGKCEVEYVSEETIMHAYLNTHLAIEGLRREAAERQNDPPRILVIGGSRTTVSRILLNYGIRSGRTPMYVDLDPADGNLALPGAIGAKVLDRLIDIDESGLEGQQPIEYFYGSLAPMENSKLYRRLVARLAFTVNGKLASLADANKSGAIICTPSECEEFLPDWQQQFRVNLILVIGNERLFVTVSKLLGDRSGCTVVKLPKSGGVVDKDVGGWRRYRQQFLFARYFYGAHREYSPFSLVIPFDEISIRKLGEERLAPKSALPLGATRKVDESKATAASKVEITGALLYSILAISWGANEEQIGEANVAGYVYVTAVDETKKQVTLLSICPGKLPSQFLLQGNLKWIEQ